MNDNDILNNLAQYQKIVSEIVSNPIDTNNQNKSSSSSSSSTSTENFTFIGKILINHNFIAIIFFFIILFTCILYKLEPFFCLNEKQISYKNGIKQTDVSILLCISYSLGLTLLGIIIFFIVKLNLKN